VAGLAAAAVAGALTSARGAPRSDPARVGGGGAQGVFGPHYATLDQRREAAHIPTMMKTMNSPVHFHAHLTLWMNGKRVPIPAGIGIDPTQDAMQMAGLHTHDSSGTIHVEGVEGSTLGQFFAIWGLPHGRTRRTIPRQRRKQAAHVGQRQDFEGLRGSQARRRPAHRHQLRDG